MSFSIAAFVANTTATAAAMMAAVSQFVRAADFNEGGEYELGLPLIATTADTGIFRLARRVHTTTNATEVPTINAGNVYLVESPTTAVTLPTAGAVAGDQILVVNRRFQPVNVTAGGNGIGGNGDDASGTTLKGREAALYTRAGSIWVVDSRCAGPRIFTNPVGGDMEDIELQNGDVIRFTSAVAATATLTVTANLLVPGTIVTVLNESVVSHTVFGVVIPAASSARVVYLSSNEWRILRDRDVARLSINNSSVPTELSADSGSDIRITSSGAGTVSLLQTNAVDGMRMRIFFAPGHTTATALTLTINARNAADDDTLHQVRIYTIGDTGREFAMVEFVFWSVSGWVVSLLQNNVDTQAALV